MTLSKYQLERTDLTVMLEQGRRVEGELFAENHRSLQTMGELLKARMFGSTEYAIGLRKRMVKYASGKGAASSAGRVLRPEAPRTGSREPFPDPHPEHGVLCDCPDCDEAVKRLLRDCGILPKGKDLNAADWDWAVSGGAVTFRRHRTEPRYQRDESDR